MKIVPFLFCLVATLACTARGAENLTRRPIGSGSAGLAWSTTTPDVPLGFTTQIFGAAADGRFEAGIAAQTKQALANLEQVLRQAGGTLRHTLKLNFYITDDGSRDAVLREVASVFATSPVPVSFVRTRLAASGAEVSVDAVVQLPTTESALRVLTMRGAVSPAGGADLGVLPAGRKVFLSGLASRTKGGFREALREVFEAQAITLRHHGLTPSSIVQVKGWVAPLEELADFRAALATFFGPVPVPPVVLIEWETVNGVEIEFVLAGGSAEAARFSGSLAFGTRPGAEASTRFSHIAFVEAGQPLIFTSGIYGTAGASARDQLQDIFAQLGRVLFDAGSGFRHLAKATYQMATPEARTLLGEIRDVYFDPARPPAASGVLVRGTGSSGHVATLDMIAVPIPRATKQP